MTEIFEADNNMFPSDVTFDWEQRIYKICLPWKPDCRPEFDCYQLYLSRLKHLQGRLRVNPLMSVKYDAIFQKQLQQGIIRRVQEEEEGFDNCYTFTSP